MPLLNCTCVAHTVMLQNTKILSIFSHLRWGKEEKTTTRKFAFRCKFDGNEWHDYGFWKLFLETIVAFEMPPLDLLAFRAPVKGKLFGGGPEPLRLDDTEKHTNSKDFGPPRRQKHLFPKSQAA